MATEYGVVGSNSSIATAVASTTWFAPFGGEGALTQASTSEAPAQLKFRGAGVLSRLYANVPTNTRTTTSTVTARKGGADAGLTVSIGAGLTGVFSDLSGSASYADGDLWNYAVTTGSGSGSLVVAGVSARLATTTQIFTQQAGYGSLASTLGRALGFAGSLVNTSAASTVGVRALQAATLSNLQIVVTANASAGFTATLQKNGSNGNQTISVGAGLTGIFEDTTNTDTVAAGDYVNLATSTPSASITVTAVGVKALGAVASRVPADCGSNIASLTPGTTRYSGLWGRSIRSATEASTQSPMPTDATLSALSVFVRSNASTTAASFKSRINGADGAQTVSITALTTGLYQDLTHTDDVAAGDLISTVISGGTTGNIDASWTGMLVTADAAPVPPAANDDLMLLGVG